MVRDWVTRRFVYTEQLERRPVETSWEYVRRSVRREARVRDRFNGETLQVIVGWGAGSVEEFLESYPEYRPAETNESEPVGRTRSSDEAPDEIGTRAILPSVMTRTLFLQAAEAQKTLLTLTFKSLGPPGHPAY
jgi:hypothetical protein